MTRAQAVRCRPAARAARCATHQPLHPPTARSPPGALASFPQAQEVAAAPLAVPPLPASVDKLLALELEVVQLQQSLQVGLCRAAHRAGPARRVGAGRPRDSFLVGGAPLV